MNWEIYKRATEYKYKFLVLDPESENYQIQPNAKLGKGLSWKEINDLEALFGFRFPMVYKSLLRTINGLETLQISRDPEGLEPDHFHRYHYKYPEDYEKVLWRMEECMEYIKYTKECLTNHRCSTVGIEGFIPLYSNRLIVVHADKSLSPVISVGHGSDVVFQGYSLIDYFSHEWCYAPHSWKYYRNKRRKASTGRRSPFKDIFTNGEWSNMVTWYKNPALRNL